MTAPLELDQILNIDQQHIWHPYSSVHNANPLYVVDSAEGVYLNLKSGERLIDGMSSWWSTLHGYNHPALNEALTQQMQKMAHVMFGGLTHEPAAKLASKLVEITPTKLQQVFFSDSGSVAVEVAMKMTIQFWRGKGQKRHTFLTLKKGYHGDTFAAMSVCDPITGMHGQFSGVLAKQLFANQPQIKINEAWNESDFEDFKTLFHQHKNDIAGVILEPIVQGTGGMHFYSPEYLKCVRNLTSEYGIPLIADEIATGLGRTGKLFACEHAGIEPDIMCLGKTLSAGYITLAATLCTQEIAETICQGEAGVFMHGPTFMGNPLACAVASRSIDLLFETPWETQITNLESALIKNLKTCRTLKGVAEVRVLGGIGVIEMQEAVDLAQFQPLCVENGIWLRPFGKLIYMMPPYITSEAQIKTLCETTGAIIERLYT